MKAKQTVACGTHEAYATEELAKEALAELIAHARKTGRGGKSWKNLNYFACRDHWHVGRRNQLPTKAKPEPKEKSLTVGQAMRKLRNLDAEYARQTDHYHRRMAELVGKLIAADAAGN